MVASAQLTGVASAVVSDAGSATSNTVGYVKNILSRSTQTTAVPGQRRRWEL